MTFNLQKMKVCALPDLSGWSEIYDGGSFLLLVSTKKDSANVSDLVTLRSFFKRVHDEFELSNLKDAINKVCLEFKDVLGEIQVSAVSSQNEFLQTVAFGGGEVYIYRNQVMAAILKSNSDELVSARGPIQDQDVIILGTKEFFNKIDYLTIKASLARGGPVAAVGEIENKLEEDQVKGPVGAYFIKFISSEVGQNPVIVNEVQDNKIEVPQVQKHNPTTSILTSIKSKIFSLVPERQIFVKNTEFNPQEEQSKKTTMTAGILLLVILFVSIFFGIRQKSQNNLKAKYEGKLIEAQHNIDEAVGLTGVSPERARELFSDSESKLKEIQSLNVKDSRIDDLARLIDEKRASILGEYNTEPSLYLDLTLLSSGFTANFAAVSSGELYLLDSSNKKLVKVEIENKKSKVVAGSDKINKADGLAVYSDRAFILNNDEGIIEVGSTNKTVLEKDWDGPPLIHSFAGNMYLLARDSNSIYRYAGQSDQTFGSKYDWLSKSVTTDFSNVKGWTMDGSIYVVTTTNKIAKFSRGSTQSFNIKGVYPELNSIEAIYANEDNEYFYILDKEGKRVVVLTKSGEYKAQYVNEKIGEANNIIVSEKDKKILLLTGSKILSIEVKH